MADQADHLRRLVQEAAHQGPLARSVPLVVVAGGQRGVGVSTVALHLALAWQRQKRKSILVDASFHEPSFYAPGAPGRAKRHDTLVDVLSGGRTVSEVVRTGPHGLAILPGAALPPALADVPAKSWAKVIGQLRSLQASADVILFDAGAGSGVDRVPLWHAASLVLLATRSEPVAVTDTYAVLKSARNRMDLPKVDVVANHAVDDHESHAASARIASAASRFLNLTVDVLPSIPFSSELAGETAATSRLHKESALRNAFAQMAERVWCNIEEPSASLEAPRAA
jgi:flagellar biosynthesis protein FlhG